MAAPTVRRRPRRTAEAIAERAVAQSTGASTTEANDFLSTLSPWKKDPEVARWLAVRMAYEHEHPFPVGPKEPKNWTRKEVLEWEPLEKLHQAAVMEWMKGLDAAYAAAGFKYPYAMPKPGKWDGDRPLDEHAKAYERDEAFDARFDREQRLVYHERKKGW